MDKKRTVVVSHQILVNGSCEEHCSHYCNNYTSEANQNYESYYDNYYPTFFCKLDGLCPEWRGSTKEEL